MYLLPVSDTVSEGSRASPHAEEGRVVRRAKETFTEGDEHEGSVQPSENLASSTISQATIYQLVAIGRSANGRPAQHECQPAHQRVSAHTKSLGRVK